MIKFIEYANSFREKNLESLVCLKGEVRTDLHNDFKISAFFIQVVLSNDDKNDLDE